MTHQEQLDMIRLQSELEKALADCDALAAALERVSDTACYAMLLANAWMKACDRVQAGKKPEYPQSVDIDAALVALKRQERIAGGREALKCREACEECRGAGKINYRIVPPSGSDEGYYWRSKDCPLCGTESWEPKE